jgi:hypothetical protein
VGGGGGICLLFICIADMFECVFCFTYNINKKKNENFFHLVFITDVNKSKKTQALAWFLTNRGKKSCRHKKPWSSLKCL